MAALNKRNGRGPGRADEGCDREEICGSRDDECRYGCEENHAQNLLHLTPDARLKSLRMSRFAKWARRHTVLRRCPPNVYWIAARVFRKGEPPPMLRGFEAGWAPRYAEGL